MADVAINFTGKVCGFNLTSKPGFPLEAAYWAEWDWSGWIRKQIDYAIALGANCIRLQGDVTVVNSGAISQATYNARTQQFVAYCVANGLSVYLNGCATYGTDGVGNGTTAMTDAQIAAVINSNVAAVTSGATDFRANIIGLDIVQEAFADYGVGRINALYALVKPNVPSPIGCTFSTAGGLNQNLSSALASLDYLDYHIYGTGTPPTPQDVTDQPRTSYPTKQVFFGEGGSNRVGRTAQQVTDWIAGLATLGTMSDSMVRGAMLWAVQDQQTSEKYGAFDSTWTMRDETALPWVKTFSSAAAPSAPLTPRIPHDAVILVDPRGCSTDYTGVKIYRDGSLIATVSHGYYDDSANVVPGVQYSYTAKVTTASHGDSAASSALLWAIPSTRSRL